LRQQTHRHLIGSQPSQETRALSQPAYSVAFGCERQTAMILTALRSMTNQTRCFGPISYWRQPRLEYSADGSVVEI
jgi:hypothetical protein